MASTDPISFTVVWGDASELPSTQEFRQALERGSDELKLETLRRIITATLNGSPQVPSIAHAIIQYILPSKNKTLKKLLHTYWEVCPKHDDNGKLKQEMILVVNAIRNDLQHPNEYIRGATLRSIQKIKDAELLEPLIPLEHRHSYVRKNAVLAILTIYATSNTSSPMAPNLFRYFWLLGCQETDTTCLRNGLVFLTNFLSSIDQIPSWDEQMQMAVVEVIRKDSLGDSPNRPKYIRIVYELLESSSASVKYEAATTLTTLTSNPAAVKASATTLINLAAGQPDNNVKLIVLDRLSALHEKHSADLNVKKKCISIALSMITSRNVDEVVDFLKKQLVKTVDSEFEKVSLMDVSLHCNYSGEYRQLLIQSIHVCAIRFSEVAASVVHALMDFLGDSNNASAVDVIAFVREVVQKFPNLRAAITKTLLQTFSQIKSGKVFRGALWIVGEYCTEVAEIHEAMQEIRRTIGEIPILASEQRLLDEAGGDVEPEKKEGTGASGQPRVLADGTYATETAYSSAAAARLEAVKAASKPPLRTLILQGDYFTGSVLATTLTKLVLRFRKVSKDAKGVNALQAEVMLIMTSVVRVGQSKFSSAPIDEDSMERIMGCLRTLSEVEIIFLEDTKAAYAKWSLPKKWARKAAEKREKDSKVVTVQVDDVLSFRQFSKKSGIDAFDDYEQDVSRATGAEEVKEDLLSNLSRVVQLTGFSDPVYSEAYVKVHQFDILLGKGNGLGSCAHSWIFPLDRCSYRQPNPNTLQNLCIDFATLGDLKLVERPSTYTIGPHSFHSIKATIKVSSTETGVIFGNIIWESGTTETSVVLNDIHIDIMDYIKPAYCNEAAFRSMWTEFEWENRVNVNTGITDLREYLQHIMKSTNMACLTPEAALEGDCDFLSANLYARSLFGEDALANLSIEKAEDTGAIQGHVRIRSKTQGIALSLGDKITLAQKRKPIALIS
ncbi:coatomer protein [Cantharellus anzutake]|uniref:coatomer protein n=1 Tax=Cantharellus anzutake TaxID=1750568 RepID=UPI0019087F20|nr:coatomer protein [Cantharellus anzutake]KAF8336939.1 coatomer protein [Cantharellus anzutake]